MALMDKLNIQEKGYAVFCRAGDPASLAYEARDALATLHHVVVKSADHQS